MAEASRAFSIGKSSRFAGVRRAVKALGVAVPRVLQTWPLGEAREKTGDTQALAGQLLLPPGWLAGRTARGHRVWRLMCVQHTVRCSCL